MKKKIITHYNQLPVSEMVELPLKKKKQLKQLLQFEEKNILQKIV